MSEKPKILVVDDEPGLCEVLSQLFSNKGYDCQIAESSEQALSLVEKFQPQVVLSDICLPGMDGLGLTSSILTASPDTGIVLMTGNANVDMAVQALRLGAADFLLKPFNFKTVLYSVHKAISEKQSRSEAATELVQLKLRLQKLLKDNESITFAAIESICRTLDLRDPETFVHSQRVSNYCSLLGRKMSVAGKDFQDIKMGGLLHDIGKVVVPDLILLKPGPLTEEERTLMEKHVQAGYAILTGIPGMEAVAQIVLQHHEEYAGGGYPQELKGEEICLGARIFAVADTYDAITNDRPYRKARSYAVARKEICKYSGLQFDPKIVEAFLRIPAQEWTQAAGQAEEELGEGARRTLRDEKTSEHKTSKVGG